MNARDLNDILDHIAASVPLFGTELILALGVLTVLSLALKKNPDSAIIHATALLFFILATVSSFIETSRSSSTIFLEMFRTGGSFGSYLKILFSVSGGLTVAMTWRNPAIRLRLSEYYSLLLTVVLGANLLVMSENLLAVFLAIEMISIPSYVLAGFAFEKKSAEASLKYFIYGSIASAIMLYGTSILYGTFGTLNFTQFQLPAPDNLVNFYIGGALTLAGFLFKIAAAPMHPWAPDVYEAAPMPIVAFFSVVPKLAGISILMKFALFSVPAGINWQSIICGIAILTLIAGNFAALLQKGVRRLMAYSSIGQSGFFLAGVAAGSVSAAEAIMFYATIYLLLNFALFFFLQYFENRAFTTIASFEGSGRSWLLPNVLMLISFIALTGLPPTAGFTGKLFIFSALWNTYALNANPLLLGLLVFGLLNTVISLFYYLRIPYYAFIKPQREAGAINNPLFENFFATILVLLVLLFFFSPQLLMGWINRSNFVF